MTFYMNPEDVEPLVISASQISESEMRDLVEKAKHGPHHILPAGSYEMKIIPPNIRHENRCKMLLIHERDILTLLNFHREGNQFLALPVGGQIPVDAVVESVSYQISFRGFLLRVWSNEFPIVPPGEQAPMLFPMIEAHNLRKMEIVPKDKPLSEDAVAIVDAFRQQYERKPEYDFFFKGE